MFSVSQEFKFSTSILLQFNHLIIFFTKLFFIILLFTLAPSKSWSIDPLRVGVSGYSPPFSYVEGEKSTPQGFSVDLAKLLAENMGVIAEIYPMNDSDLIESLKKGDLDLVIGIMDNSYATMSMIKTSVHANKNYFVNSGCSTFNSYKDIFTHTVAIEEGRTLSWLLSSKDDIIFLKTKSQEDALALVDSGKAQVYVSKNTLTTDYIIRKNNFLNIKEINSPLEMVPLAIAVKNKDPELLTSLSVAYGKIIENDSFDGIYIKWIAKDYQYIIRHYFKHIITIAILILFIFILSVFWNFSLKRKIDNTTKDLKISERRYKDLIEMSPDMVYLISLDGDIRLVNNTVLTSLGYSEKEMFAMKIYNFIFQDQKDKMNDFIENTFRYKYSKDEFIFKAKKNRIYVDMVATCIEMPYSIEKLVCIFARDITFRKHMEEDLIHSERLAMMGQMAAGIAHEINNPLSVILSYAQDAIAHEPSREESIECLKSIERNAFRAAKIIENMLSFARRSPILVVPFDLLRVIDSSLFLLRQKLKKKKIKVEKKYSFDSVIINGEENLIQQLLINIILNSIHAIKQGGSIEIRIKLIQKNGNNNIVVEIEDNGIGIAEEDLYNIFNPFFTSRKENGFGLGLFISKIIVKKHQANIFAYSKVGKGTIMTIEFPSDATETYENLKIEYEK